MLTARHLVAGALVFGLLVPALPAEAADVELQGLCGDYGDHVEYWAEAHRRHSEEGTLSVRIYRTGGDVAGESDATAEFGKDPKRGPAGPGQSGGPQYGMWIWQVPEPQKGDPAFGRRVGHVKKPVPGEKYFIEVKFQAPDAFITLTHDCEK